MSRALIVDDSDPAIHYTGGWTTATSVSTNTNEYNSTVHRSETAGDELSYTFFGTGIKVFGTLDRPATNGPPSAFFSVDGSPPTAFNASGTVIVDSAAFNTSHIVLYETSGLSEDSHTLSIKTGTPTNPAARLYVDFFTVTRGSNVATGNIILDERDPLITYSGSWLDYGVADEYMHTSRVALSAGNDFATFRFNGTSATVFGTAPATTRPSTAAVIGFKLDGIPKANFTGPSNSQSLKHIPFFHAEGLSNDQEHTLEITNLSDNIWFLDYIVYTTSKSSIPSGGNSRPQNGGSNMNADVFAGVLVAAVVGLLALAAFIFMLQRRRKALHTGRENDEKINHGVPNGQGAFVVPFRSFKFGAHAYKYPHGHQVSTSSVGLFPTSKEKGPNAISTTLPNAIPEPVYFGVKESAQGGFQLVDTSSTYRTSPSWHHSGPKRSSPPLSYTSGHEAYESYTHHWLKFDETAGA